MVAHAHVECAREVLRAILRLLAARTVTRRAEAGIESLRHDIGLAGEGLRRPMLLNLGLPQVGLARVAQGRPVLLNLGLDNMLLQLPRLDIRRALECGGSVMPRVPIVSGVAFVPGVPVVGAALGVLLRLPLPVGLLLSLTAQPSLRLPRPCKRPTWLLEGRGVSCR